MRGRVDKLTSWHVNKLTSDYRLSGDLLQLAGWKVDSGDKVDRGNPEQAICSLTASPKLGGILSSWSRLNEANSPPTEQLYFLYQPNQLYQLFNPNKLTSQHVNQSTFQLIVEVSRSINPQISQNTRLRTNSKIERAVQTYRRYVNAQLPAVHFTRNIHGEGLYCRGLDVIIPVHPKLPFGRKVEIAIPAQVRIWSGFPPWIIAFKLTVKAHWIG